jgi:hypothetical protein
VYLASPFRVMCSLSGSISFKDDGAVKQILTKREVQVCGWVAEHMERLARWKGVDYNGDGGFGDVLGDGG